MTKVREPEVESSKAEPLWTRVRSPKSARWLSLLMLGLLFASAICLVLVPWQQNIPGVGRVVAYVPFERQQQLEAPIEGRVVRWFVQEGSFVKQGQVIAELSDIDPHLVEHLQQEQASMEERLGAVSKRKRALAERIVALEKSKAAAMSSAEARTHMAGQRVRMAKQALEAMKAGLSTARKNRKRHRNLQEEGLSSSRTQELAELDYARAFAELKRSEASLIAAESEHEAFRIDRIRIEQETSALLEDAKSSLANVEGEIQLVQAELARLAVRVSRQKSQVIKAPKDGTIFRILVNVGAEVVKNGKPLALFVPDTVEKAAEIWVDGNDIPLISIGRSVRLQFEGWPAIQFVGWPSAAVGTFGGIVALVDATDDGNGRFRVVVLPDPKDPWPESRYLRQGVRVNGWVLLNQVSLGFELWRQLNGFPPTILPPGKPQSPKSQE